MNYNVYELLAIISIATRYIYDDMAIDELVTHFLKGFGEMGMQQFQFAM